MRRALVFGLSLAAALLGACAANEPREKPHHYSSARDGTRLACYTGNVANEYECVPVRAFAREFDPYYDPFYDPWWRGRGYPALYGFYPAYPYPANSYPIFPAPPLPNWHRPRAEKP